MVKSIWHACKFALVILAVIWVKDHPGQVTIDWLGEVRTISLSLILLGLIAVIAVSSYVGRIFAYIRKLPDTMRRYRYMQGSLKGIELLTAGYAALAGGDGDAAEKYLTKARAKLPETFEQGLALSLEAQIAKDQGDQPRRKKILEQMLGHDKTAMIGLRGLLADLMETRQYAQAKALLEDHQTKLKSGTWLSQIRYGLALGQEDWEQARALIPPQKLRRPLAAQSSQTPTEMIALLHLSAETKPNDKEMLQDLKAALKLDETFPPTIAKICAIYLKMKKPRKAAAILDKAWAKAPHPDLVPVFDSVFEFTIKKNNKKSTKADITQSRLKYFKKLAARHQAESPLALEGHIALADKAIEAKDWPLARRSLDQCDALSSPPTARIFLLRAKLEEHQNNDSLAASHFREEADQALPDKMWVCTKTGHVYAQWSPLALPHRSFNTICWSNPGVSVANSDIPESVLPGGNTVYLLDHNSQKI